MRDEIQERYVFWRFSLQDFYECCDTLELIKKVDDNAIKMALFKAAAIAYCRPFSGNEAQFKPKKWKIDEAWVSDQSLHQKLMDLRLKLFAHSDIHFREPRLAKIGNSYPISMKGFHFETAMVLVDPLNNLSKAMRELLMEKTKEYEQKHL